MNGFISTEEISDAEAVQRAKEFVFVGVDYVKEVTHKKAFRWDEKDEQSATFQARFAATRPADARNLREPLPPADIPIVAFDYGLKYNILRRLRQHGFGVAGFAGDGLGRRRARSTSRREFFSPTAPAIRRRSITSCAK